MEHLPDDVRTVTHGYNRGEHDRDRRRPSVVEFCLLSASALGKAECSSFSLQFVLIIVRNDPVIPSMKTRFRSGALVSAFFCGTTISVLAQGSLAPPGTPTPTMKTLQQIEPRTDLQATPAPPGVVTTDANYHFIINQPGS